MFNIISNKRTKNKTTVRIPVIPTGWAPSKTRIIPNVGRYASETHAQLSVGRVNEYNYIRELYQNVGIK